MKLTACKAVGLDLVIELNCFSGFVSRGRFWHGGQAEIAGVHRFDWGTPPAGILACLAALFASCLILSLFEACELFLTFLELSI